MSIIFCSLNVCNDSSIKENVLGVGFKNKYHPIL